MFLSAYREYVKSHHKVFRLEACFDPLRLLLEFLRDKRVQIRVATSVMRLWLRTCFWHYSREVGSISKAVEQMLEQGLVEHILELDADEVPKVDLWLHVMMHDTLAVHMEHTSADQEEEAKESLRILAGDTAQVNALLEGIEDPTAHGCLRHVGEDALAFSVVLKAWCEDNVDIRALKDAVERLKSKRMKTVHQSFSKGSGPEVLSMAGDLLQRSGRDDAADAKLTLALQRLQDEKVPRLVVAGEGLAFTGLDSIHDMSAVQFLDEIVSDVGEAMASWSPYQRDQQAASVRNVATSLIDIMGVISDALVYDMVGVVMSTDAHSLISDGPEDASSWDQGRARAAFQELDSRLAMYMVDDTPFQAFLKRLSGWLQTLQGTVLEDASSCQLAADAVSRALANCRACAQVDGVLRSMARLLASERLSAQDLVDEFTRQTDPVQQAASRLPLAVQLREDMGALPHVSFQMAVLETPVQLSLDFGDGVEAFLISATDATSLPQQLSRMVVRDLIGNLISEAIDIILQGVAQGVSLCKVRVPRDIPADMKISHQLASFADASTAESAKPAAAWLKQKRRDAPWAIDTTVALAKQLLLALRKGGVAVAVGVSPLCRPDADAAASSTEDLAALQAVLDVISLVSKVSSLFAWVRAIFWPSPWLYGCRFHRPCGLGVGSFRSPGTLARRGWPH